jgi:hypothetical protein
VARRGLRWPPAQRDSAAPHCARAYSAAPPGVLLRGGEAPLDVWVWRGLETPGGVWRRLVVASLRGLVGWRGLQTPRLEAGPVSGRRRACAHPACPRRTSRCAPRDPSILVTCPPRTPRDLSSLVTCQPRDPSILVTSWSRVHHVIHLSSVLNSLRRPRPATRRTHTHVRLPFRVAGAWCRALGSDRRRRVSSHGRRGAGRRRWCATRASCAPPTPSTPPASAPSAPLTPPPRQASPPLPPLTALLPFPALF